jgi:UDP-3-O-[3-hydroxymyristoyl] glucosamine N-acyltransferase
MERKKIEGSLRISQIAEALGGHFEGEDILISGIKPVDQPVKDCLTPLFDKKWVEKALSGCAGAFLVPDGYGFSADRPVVFVKDIKPALSKVIELFYPVLTKHSGISEKAIVAGGASVHPSAVIEAGAIVEDCAQIGAGTVVCCGAFIGRGAVIGENCYIYPNVTIYYGCTLGDGVIIHSSAVVGSDGFGYYQAEGVSYKIPQVGGVVIGNDVEIGSCAAIDRGALGDTVIGEGTKIDNLVQVAHNTVIGKHCILAGQTGISGSCNIGDFVM